MARIIVFLIFGGFGLVMLYVGATQFFQQRKLLAESERVDAVVTYSQVFTSTTSDTDTRLNRSNSTTTHRPDVNFKYVVAGQEYESDLLYPTIIVQTSASRESAAEELAEFPVGARVRAFVNREHPDKAFLVAQSSSAPLVFIVIGVLLPPLAWFAGKLV